MNNILLEIEVYNSMSFDAASTCLPLPLLCQLGKRVNQRKLFAKRLRRHRKAANLSLAKAGEKGGLRRKYWAEVERSEKSPTLERVLNMADALDVPIHALVQIEREEDEERILRKRLDNILDNSSVYQLKRLYCYLLTTPQAKIPNSVAHVIWLISWFLDHSPAPAGRGTAFCRQQT